MRSRRSDIWARRAELCSLRSARLSLGPANDFRRARASEDVMGAGAIGPLRPASRRGVGRPLGAVVCGVRGAIPSTSAVGEATPRPSSLFRPSSFTPARLLRDAHVWKTAGSARGLTVAQMSGSAPDRPALRLLIAPDSFGDTLTAVQTAAAIAAGWNRVRPGDRIVIA